LRKTVAQRDNPLDFPHADNRRVFGRLGSRFGAIPLSSAFACFAILATGLYADSARDHVSAHASDRLSILADGALVQVSMAVTRAEPDQMREAANPALLNALAYRHLANGIYAYVLDQSGEVVASTRLIDQDAAVTEATMIQPLETETGYHHPLDALEGQTDASETFDAVTEEGQATLTAVRPLPEPFSKLVVAMPTQRVHHIWLTEIGPTVGLVSIPLLGLLGLALPVAHHGPQPERQSEGPQRQKAPF
jgi:hypothetical protein